MLDFWVLQIIQPTDHKVWGAQVKDEIKSEWLCPFPPEIKTHSYLSLKITGKYLLIQRATYTQVSYSWIMKAEVQVRTKNNNFSSKP